MTTVPEERRQLRDRTIAELYHLHEEVLDATQAVTAFSGPAARRRLRDAKAAEADLMRVLGFGSWEQFEQYVGDRAPQPLAPPRTPRSSPPTTT